jgi:ribosome-associated protein
MSGLFIRHGLIIPDTELTESFIQSGGPGGQNVNKVASAVQLRFDVGASPSLAGWVKAAFFASGDTRLDSHGILTITARRFREQARNRADARARLTDVILKAATPKNPRRPTRPPFASKKRRAEAKKLRGRVKKARARPDLD